MDVTELVKESLRLDAEGVGEGNAGVGTEAALRDPLGHLTSEVRPMRAVARHVLAMTSDDEALLVTLAAHGSSNDRGALQFSSNLTEPVLEALCSTIEPDDSFDLVKKVLTHEALTQRALDQLSPDVLRHAHAFKVNAETYRGVRLDMFLTLADEWALDASAQEMLEAAGELDAH
jgi:hypothetical protein